MFNVLRFCRKNLSFCKIFVYRWAALRKLLYDVENIHDLHVH